MWATNQRLLRAGGVRASKQTGTAAVEFALLAIVFFTLVFGVFEIARMVYLFNTLQEVTRRAAALAVNSPFDQNAQDTIRRQALIADKSGNLLLGQPVTPAHLRLEYLSLSRGAAGGLTLSPVAPLPANPAENRLNCLADPYGATCIRFVRVRICQPNAPGACTPVPYQMLFPIVRFSGLVLPRATSTAPAQSLGYTAGTLPGA